MKTVKIIDFQSTNDFHEMINLSMAIICSNIFEKTIYKSGKSSNSNLQKLYQSYKNKTLKQSNIIFKPKTVYEKQGKISFQIRIICGFFITIYEFLTTKKNETLLYTYTNALSLPLILLLNIFFQKKIIFLMHGELELHSKDKIPFYKPTSLYKILHKISFKYFLSQSSAYILLLGDSIKENLCKIYPNIENHIISICHPYIIENTSKYQTNKINNTLNIGTIGLINKSKGIDNLIKLSNLLSNEILSNKLKISSIGKVTDINTENYTLIEWIGGHNSVPREIFEQKIKELDYILYLYPQNSYKLTASGAILDAIKLRKPIISLTNDYFKYILKDNPIGYSGENIIDIVNIIKNIIKGYNLEKDFSKQFDSLTEKISIEHNTDILKKELIKHNII